MDAPFVIETPLMKIEQGRTMGEAEKLGGAALVELIVAHTHTCLRPTATTWHAWGYGCRHCPACSFAPRDGSNGNRQEMIRAVTSPSPATGTARTQLPGGRGGCHLCWIHAVLHKTRRCRQRPATGICPRRTCLEAYADPKAELGGHQGGLTY